MMQLLPLISVLLSLPEMLVLTGQSTMAKIYGTLLLPGPESRLLVISLRHHYPIILTQSSLLFFCSMAVTKSTWRDGGHEESVTPLLSSILKGTFAEVTRFQPSLYQRTSSLCTKSFGWNLFALGGSP